MNVLITNIWFQNYGGTECYVRDLAIKLQSEGVKVEVYSPLLGRISKELIDLDINVVSSVNDLKNIPDIIHGHHSVTLDAINKFPDVPVIFFCHGIGGAEEPIEHPQIKKYVTVSHYIREIITAKIHPENVEVIYNWVNTDFFVKKEIIQEKPLQALVFSNSLPQDKGWMIQRACNKMDISIKALGGHVNMNVSKPERIIPEFDIVFAVGKSAIESMACGCAVILLDSPGMGEMVTPANFEYCRKYNFGLKNLTNEITEENIQKEVAKYNFRDLVQVTDTIRKEAAFDISFNKIMELYKQVCGQV